MEPANNIDTQEPFLNTRTQWELADVFRLYIDQYRKRYPLNASQKKVVRDIMACRTEALGGHEEECDCCHSKRNAYNSCRNRHCPKCQTSSVIRWLEARKAEILPVSYFHCVFTLPHLLNPIVLCNKPRLFDILFRTVACTLLEFGRNPENHLGGKLGFISVLHTWNQRLMDHFHLHVLVPAGALAANPDRWISSHPRFLFPVIALSKVFRGKFIRALQKDFDKSKLRFPGSTADMEDPVVFADLIERLWKSPWVVYSKRPFAGPEQVLDYLGRYTHRVALTNNRIRNIDNGVVTLSYRDRRDQNKSKVMNLDAVEFIHRFLLHVLPRRFMRIRHFGFLSSRTKKHDIGVLHKLFGLPQPENAPQAPSLRELMLHCEIDITRCPFCHRGTMRPVSYITPTIHVAGEKPSARELHIDSS